MLIKIILITFRLQPTRKRFVLFSRVVSYELVVLNFAAHYYHLGNHKKSQVSEYIPDQLKRNSWERGPGMFFLKLLRWVQYRAKVENHYWSVNNCWPCANTGRTQGCSSLALTDSTQHAKCMLLSKIQKRKTKMYKIKGV